MAKAKEKKGEVVKVDEVKKARKLIKALENASIVSSQELRTSDSRRRDAESRVRRLEGEYTALEGCLEKTKQKLSDIQKAIGTAAAMRYPEAQIVYKADTYYIPPTEPRPQPDESEDVRLLRHLYELCN